MKYPKDAKIEQVITDMLKENTGEHFLDSGGAYGRHWQRNQEKKFEDEPEMTVTVEEKGVCIEVSTFHFLTHHLTVSEAGFRLNEKFLKFANKPENKDEGWLYIMEEFAKSESVSNDDFMGNGEPSNTYNWECPIDQTLQFCLIHQDDKDFVILQIHGGCDVRGGYTDPTVLEIEDRDEFCMAMQEVQAYCNSCHEEWMQDSTGYWYPSIEDGLVFDVKNQKVTCKKCGTEIQWSCGLLNPITKEEVIANEVV